METTISFEGKKAGEAAAYYISQASKYRGETTEDNGNGDKMKQDSSDPIEQIKRLQEVRKKRDNGKVKENLVKLKEVSEGDENVVPALLDCVRSYASEGEIADVWRKVFGTWRQPEGW